MLKSVSGISEKKHDVSCKFSNVFLNFFLVGFTVLCTRDGGKITCYARCMKIRVNLWNCGELLRM